MQLGHALLHNTKKLPGLEPRAYARVVGVGVKIVMSVFYSPV